MLAVSQETGAHHRMEKSNSVVSSRSRDKFRSVKRDPPASGSQLWRGTIQSRGAIGQVASVESGEGICSWVSGDRVRVGVDQPDVVPVLRSQGSGDLEA